MAAPPEQKSILFRGCFSLTDFLQKSASELCQHGACSNCSTDNACYVRAHSLHEQVVGRVVAKTYHLGYAGCHWYGRYACGTDQRVYLVARCNSHDLAEEYAACGACCECNQAEADDFQGLYADEFVAGHGKACAGCQDNGNDAGGMTCHASIVSRELGIPCVVGTKSRSVEATKVLKSGQDITIDAQNGVVYEGIVEDLVKKDEPKQAAGAAGTTVVAAEYFAPTGTGVMMNLGDPDLADKYASLPCDGIGLMREEFIWTTFIHEHPLYLIEQGKPEKVIDMLAEGISKVCRALAPRPVVLRFSDFKSGEYRNLKGGDKYEPVEPADLLGWRGASRYYDPKYTAAFRLELKAVKKVREEYGLKNLNCMIPFCRTVAEAAKVTAIMKEEGLERGPDFKLFLMAEIPSNIILADQFNQYIDGYSIGSNDLTMLILGCDRNNDTVSALFDERNLAIKRAVRHLIATAHKDGKTVSICGQAPSVYPDFTEFLVKSGIDYVSVNPDMVKATKRNVARIEQRLMLDAATGRGLKEVEDYNW